MSGVGWPHPRKEQRAREDGSKVLAISLFENEEAMRQGDAALNSMDPPTQEGMGKRTSVEMYEVPIKLEA